MEGEVELEVIGRHAMLFDDDTNAAFVNSNEALVEWNNSLFIDRYDVRHLLSNPPPSFRKLTRHSSSPPPDSQLDLERYADLPSSSSSDQPEVETGVEAKDTTAFHAVPFSYGTSTDSTDQKTSDVAMDISTFHPSFPVPESLLQNLMGAQPPTEKLHQIIARTAIFVGKHGAQSEIVLRVKQGDNPTFGFLMPHHRLHPYFRYLVDHPELVEADSDSKSQDEKAHENQASGALSLLGSVYGSGEDDDGPPEADRESKQSDSGGTSTVGGMPNSQQLEQSITSGNVAQTDDKSSKLVLSSKVKATALSKNRIFNIKPAYANGMRKDGDIMGSSGLDIDKSKAPCLFPIPKVEVSLVDPPSGVKRLVDRIVEIILKNGKDFETVLIEQDKKHGKFPFLLPSNQYHPYYLKALKNTHESRLTGKSFGTEDGPSWQEMSKKTASIKESDFSALESGPHDLSLDYERKEKFKMVIKSRKDSQDQPSKETQQQCGVSVDAAAAAAILQAATRGIKKPNLDIFSKTALNGTNHGSSNEGVPISSASLQTSQAQSSGIKQNENRKPSVTVPVAKEIAKTDALAAAGEADSSEAGMTREQKLKAERLRRAKMFAAMIKSGKEPLRASPAELPGTGVSGSGANIGNEVVKEREGTSVPVEAGTSNKREKLEINSSDDENEHKSRKKRHYRSRKHDDSEGEDEDEVKKDEDEEDRRHSRKKHRSHRSSRHHRDKSRDKHKHRRRHSSKSKESRHRHKHKDSSSDDDDRHHQHKHDSFSEDEHRHHKRRHNHDSSSEDERKQHKRMHKRSRKDEDKHEGRSRKVEGSHDEVELEEGEIRTKSSDQSPSTIGDDICGETFVDVSKSSDQEKRTHSVPPSESTEVSDELRAKIRAMLLATM